jgi:hypothetical protein
MGAKKDFEFGPGYSFSKPNFLPQTTTAKTDQAKDAGDGKVDIIIQGKEADTVS